MRYIDMYCLSESRDKTLAFHFLNTYIPNNVEAAVDYPVPMFSDSPNQLLTNVNDLIDFLGSAQNEEYSIYWNNQNEQSIIKSAMLFYTDDGSLICGLSVYFDTNEDELIHLFKSLKNFLNSDIAYITQEEPPPMNSKAFIKRVTESEAYFSTK